MRICFAIVSILCLNLHLSAQVEKNAGNWKTWFITSGKDYVLPAPVNHKNEINEVLSRQKQLSKEQKTQIDYWNAGSPGYRWYDMISKIWVVDTSRYGAVAGLLVSTAIYDATVAAWASKYKYNRPRPYQADSRISLMTMKPESPSYPCETSVAAGAAATIIAHFYPALKDSVHRMAERAMNSRVAAGVAFPSDVQAGFDLGKKIAEAEIAATKDFVDKASWDGKMPAGPEKYSGKFTMLPMLAKNKTVVLTNASQFRPEAPKDFEKEMAELKAYKQTFRSRSNAYYWANANYWSETLSRKILEHNLHFNAPRAARIYAAFSVATYDGVVSCWDAKYAYWGIRPDQYDTTYKSLLPTPPFPGYPSGHASASGVASAMLTYFFPEDAQVFEIKAKEAALSRFQAGIHFKSDNEVGLDMGRKVAAAVIERISKDGVDDTYLNKQETQAGTKSFGKKNP